MNLPLSFGNRFIAPLIPEFCRRHPEVRIGVLADSPLQARRLGDSEMLVCAAPSYLDQRGVPRRVAELTQHNCLSYTLSAKQGRRHWAFGAAGEYRVAVQGNLAANNGDALLAAAGRGQGIVYQPHFIVGEALARGELVALALDKPPVALGGIHVLYPPDRRPPAKVRVMVDYLAEVFARGTPGP